MTASPSRRLRVVGALAWILGAAGAPAVDAATITVSSFADDTTTGNCTLREAIEAASTNAATDLCPAGSAAEPDVIELTAGHYTWSQGYVFLSAGNGAIVVRGPAPPPAATIDLTTAQRFTRLLSGANLTLENLQLQNGDVRSNQSTKSGGAIVAQDTSDVSLTLRRVRLTGNFAHTGGALYFESGGASRLLIERSSIDSNHAELTSGAGQPEGGGLYVYLRDSSTGRIVDCSITGNFVESTVAGTSAVGGGMAAGTGDQAQLELRRLTITGNLAEAGAGVNPEAAGLRATSTGGQVRLEDLLLSGNNLVSPALINGQYAASALDVFLSFSGSASLDRIRIQGNDPGDTARHVVVQQFSTESFEARSVLVAGGPQLGAVVTAYDGTATLAHWTVAGHTFEGLRLEALNTASVRLDNSILSGNDDDLVESGSPVIDSSNWIGADPLFANPAGGDYSLQALSPAIDFGDQSLASVGPFDLGHGPRVFGLDTDAGAHEWPTLFADDLEDGERGPWSRIAP